MSTKLITTTDPNILRVISENPNFESIEPFKTNPNNHKFKIGDICELTGLVDFPEYNGTNVEITSVRIDGEYGKTYYIKGAINKFLNWTYEYRLKIAEKV